MSNKKDCNGCSHLKYLSYPEDYCYMFEKKPETELPCKQHDKFKEDREIVKQIFLKHPDILKLYLIGILNDS
jgi:hypothetical protein